MKKIFVKTLGLWFLLGIFANLNGLIRNYVYKPWVGDLLAHQISTLAFVVIIFLVVYFCFRKEIKNISSKKLFLIGFVWLLMTEAFEFLFGHYIFGHSWEKLFADYNIFAGRLWLLVPITIFFAPLIVGELLKNKK